MKTDHLESVAQQRRAASQGHAAQLSEVFTRLQSRAGIVKEETIGAANDTREAGRILLEWRDAEQMPQEEFAAFLREHAEELPLGLNLRAANHCLSAHHRYPEPITDLKDAMDVMCQMTFFATGLMSEPARKLVQSASGTAPFQMFMQPFARFRELVEKFHGDYDQIFHTAEDWRTCLAETEQVAALRETAQKKLRELAAGTVPEPPRTQRTQRIENRR